MSESPVVETSPTPLPDPTQAEPVPSSPADTPTPGSLADPHATQYAGFDPAKHRVDADGKPIMTPGGRYAKKSRSQTNAPGVSTGPNVFQAGGAGVKIDHLPIAKQIVNLAINVAVRTFGPEWEPHDKEEALTVAHAFKDYFDARGVPKIPPEFVLLGAILAYSLPRLSHENTKGKLSRMFEKVRDWREVFRRNKSR